MIEAKQLTKKFGTTVALNGITFTIGNGSVFGLVGSNGAGKSTFLRTAAGVYKPDEGSLLVDGFSPYSHIPTRERLFFISDFPYFSPNFSNIISIRLSLLMLISGALLRINRQDEHKHIKHIFRIFNI